MNRNEVIESIKAEIAKLQRVLDMLLEQPSAAVGARGPGRPKGSSNKAISFNPQDFAPAKRIMSAEGKARMVAAQKKRWAAQKAAPVKRASKSVGSKSSGKSTPIAIKKNARAGKSTGSTGAIKKTSPQRRTAVVAKKAAARKNVAKKAARPATKQPVKHVAGQAPDVQTAA